MRSILAKYTRKDMFRLIFTRGLVAATALWMLAACSGLSPQGGGAPGGGGGPQVGPVGGGAGGQESSDAGNDGSSKVAAQPALLPPLPAGDVGTRFDPQDNGAYLTKTLHRFCPDAQGVRWVEITGNVIKIIVSGHPLTEDCNGKVIRIVNYNKMQFKETMTYHDSVSGQDCAYDISIEDDFIADEPTMDFFLGKAGYTSAQLGTRLNCEDSHCADLTKFEGALSISKGDTSDYCANYQLIDHSVPAAVRFLNQGN